MTALTAAHPVLDTLSDTLLASGTWQHWRELDTRLASQPSLREALESWRRGRGRGESAYLTVAALAALGSSRGGNDNDAALAVVFLLQDGIARLANDLRDQCQPDDVMAAVWEEVKRAAPNLGHRAPRFLLQRAKARLLASAPGAVDRCVTVSLDALGEAGVRASALTGGRGGVPGPAPAPPTGSWTVQGWSPTEDPAAEEAGSALADLLCWARGTGVLGEDEVDLVVELIAAGRETDRREDAYRTVGDRHGVAMRTVRRRRDAVVHRLRAALGDYLAETA